MPRSYTGRYREHVRLADLAEAQANKRRASYREWLAKKQPNASEEWLDTECSKDHQFKALVATQQFHARQATMYGLGAILEALSSKG